MKFTGLSGTNARSRSQIGYEPCMATTSGKRPRWSGWFGRWYTIYRISKSFQSSRNL